MLEAQSQVGYSDLLSMPDDGRRYEIHGGELVVVPAPRLRHQVAAPEIFKRLDAYAATRGGRAVAAPFGIVFDEHDVVQPDVVFFRSERARLLDPDAVTRAAPDVAVEVLSPSMAKIDRGRKMRLFARYREDRDAAPPARTVRHEPGDDVFDVPLDVDAGLLLEFALSVQLGPCLAHTPAEVRITPRTSANERTVVSGGT